MARACSSRPPAGRRPCCSRSSPRSAPLVIAQVNPRMPYTFGAGELRRDELDLLVDMDAELVELRRGEPGDEARAIAGHALTCIPDGATLQFGIGAVPEALMALLG